MNEVILSTAYFGPVQYFTKFLIYNKIYIEQCENYIKQTYRNRCIIMTANGTQTLSVPVAKYNNRTQVSDIRIAYHTPWQRIHAGAIISAYRNSPYFEYYYDEISPFFNTKFISLTEMNQEITKKILELLNIPNNMEFTTEYCIHHRKDDFRNSIHPKAHQNKPDPHFYPPLYHQVFSHKFAFVPNLSIIDLLFCCGPDAKNYLLSCFKKAVY